MTPISATASLPTTTAPVQPGARAPAPETAERGFWDRLWGKEGFSFGAVLDIVNPLHHIPVVSTIYRAVSGDTIGPGPRMVGGALFGGMIGLIASAADAAVEGITGKDSGTHVMAMLPQPDPQYLWAENQERGHRGAMIAMRKQALEAATQFVEAPNPKHVAGNKAASSVETAPIPASAASPLTQSETSQDATDSPAAEGLVVNAPIPADIHQRRGFAPPPRSAELGAGGRLVPLANHGRPGGKLPTPKELAANPALLQEMRQGGASAINAPQANSGRIDTSIKGRGLVAADGVKESAAGAWLDRMGRETQALSASGAPTPAPGAPAIPQVGPDFLMKMQQALDKYQAPRPAPTIDGSH